MTRRRPRDRVEFVTSFKEGMCDLNASIDEKRRQLAEDEAVLKDLREKMEFLHPLMEANPEMTTWEACAIMAIHRWLGKVPGGRF